MRKILTISPGSARGPGFEAAGKLATAAAAVMPAGGQLCERKTAERLLADTTLTVV